MYSSNLSNNHREQLLNELISTIATYKVELIFKKQSSSKVDTINYLNSVLAEMKNKEKDNAEFVAKCKKILKMPYSYVLPTKIKDIARRILVFS